MASFLQRIFKVGQAEAHAVVDKLEDPIKMTEQGIRDMKKNVADAMKSLAEVKSLAIRLKKDAESQGKLASDYERKAMSLLQKAEAGEIDAGEAEALATEVLGKKEEAEQLANQYAADYKSQQDAADNLQAKINQMKKSISTYENQATTLKARSKTANSMKKINSQMSKFDSSSTVAMMEKMKQKVSEQESLAQAYGDMVAEDEDVDLDSRLDKALGGSAAAGKSSLEDLKAKMAANKKD